MSQDRVPRPRRADGGAQQVVGIFALPCRPLPSSAEDLPVVDPPDLPSDAPAPCSAPLPDTRPPDVRGSDCGWIYQMVVEEDWSPATLDRLVSVFLQTRDREAWAMALWALQRHPDPRVVDTLDVFARGAAPLRDRALAVQALGKLSHPQALGALQGLLSWPEEGIRSAMERAIEERAGWDVLARQLLDQVSRQPGSPSHHFHEPGPG